MKYLKCLYLALVKSQSEKDGYKGNFRGLDIYKYIQRSNAVYEVRLTFFIKIYRFDFIVTACSKFQVD